MNDKQFKKGIFMTLGEHGFTQQGNLMGISSEGAMVLVGVEKGFGDQWFINVGFCLDRIGADAPKRVEQSHMYFRLERLFPSHRELILAAGDLADPEQPDAYEVLLSHLSRDIADELRQLGSERGAIDAYRAGRFGGGLVTKFAREILSGSA